MREVVKADRELDVKVMESFFGRHATWVNIFGYVEPFVIDLAAKVDADREKTFLVQPSWIQGELDGQEGLFLVDAIPDYSTNLHQALLHLVENPGVVATSIKHKLTSPFWEVLMTGCSEHLPGLASADLLSEAITLAAVDLGVKGFRAKYGS